MIYHRHYSNYLLIIFIIFQVIFSINAQRILPKIDIIPNVPSKEFVEFFSLGDKELLFRIYTLRTQNYGDTFGRFTSLKEYDYDKLVAWFEFLDNINNRSNLIPALAIHYYISTQEKDDILKIIEYIRKRAQKDYKNNWWWMTRAVFAAQHKLKDLDLTIDLAHDVASNAPKDAPFWVKQLPAFIYEIRGEKEQAYYIIKNLLADEENLTNAEKEFMNIYIQDRLKEVN